MGQGTLTITPMPAGCVAIFAGPADGEPTGDPSKPTIQHVHTVIDMLAPGPQGIGGYTFHRCADPDNPGDLIMAEQHPRFKGITFILPTDLVKMAAANKGPQLLLAKAVPGL